MDLTRISLEPVEVDVTAALPDGSPTTIDTVQFALLPPRRGPSAATVWAAPESFTYPMALLSVAGLDVAPAAGRFIVPAGGADLWMLAADGTTYIKPVLIERINMLDGGPAGDLPISTVSDAYVAGLVTGATGTRTVLDARYVNEGQGAGGALSGSYPSPGLNETTVDSIVAGKIPGPSSTKTALDAAYVRDGDLDAQAAALVPGPSSLATALRAAFPPAALQTGPVLGAYQVFQLTSNGTDTGVNTLAKHTLPTGVGLEMLRLRFSNSQCGSNGDLDTANPVTVVCSVGLTTTGPWWPVRRNGARTMVLEAGADVETDPIALHVAAGGTFYSKTFLSVTAGQTWPGHPPAGSIGTTYWASQSNGEADLSLSTAAFTATTGTRPFAPVALVSETLPATMARVALIGDSIVGGFGDTTTIGGFAYRALQGVLPYSRIAVSGNRLNTLIDPAVGRRRLVLIRGANVALIMFGTNDIFTASRSLAQVQADSLTLWTLLRNMGIKPVACTLTPQTTSTDSWATLANQTVKAQEAVRTGFNDWLRGGAPTVAGAAVAVGTGGALLAGQAGHPLATYFEIADIAESARNSGKWIVTGAANYATADGVHPSTAMYILMAAGINTATLSSLAAS